MAAGSDHGLVVVPGERARALVRGFEQNARIQEHPLWRERHRLLFVHGTNTRAFAQLWRSGLLSDRRTLERSLLPHQEALGTHRSVYFSVSAVYPRREVVLVMTLDPTTVSVSPWDTGALWGCSSVTEIRAQTYHQHTLPDPAWRDYFAGRVVETFDDPRRYFKSKRSDHDHAVSHACRGEFFSTVFEARADGPIALAGRVVALLHPELPGTTGDHGTLIEAADALKKSGASVLTYRRNNGPSISSVFCDWMLTELRWS